MRSVGYTEKQKILTSTIQHNKIQVNKLVTF